MFKQLTVAQASLLSTSPSTGLPSLTVTDAWDYSNHRVHKVVDSNEDLLVLSATWQRLRTDAKQDNSKYVDITSLTDADLFKHITAEDKEKADKIRDHYSKKIMMWTLKGAKLSKFREDMNQFIHSDGKHFKENMCPLVYRLPEFYDYDIEFESMVSKFNKVVTTGRQQVRGIKLLKLQKTFIVGKQHSKRKEYWFSDATDNLVTISITHDNPLLSLFDNYVINPINVQAIYSTKTRDGVEYIIANKFTFG